MPLDPIVSLSVALAEAPDTCAFFLGSGVSRDAGVPTGWEILRQGLHRLRQVEQSDAGQITDDELNAWLAETGRDRMSYSELLEELAPDVAVRREFLAGFFEGVTPGPTHEALAELAVAGLVKVFVTTNFDRLLEHALQARGIEPVVVASDGDLAAAVPREHAHCMILKPHGDYLRQTIRNTPTELAELEPGMTAELGEVFERYGLVMMGYSGSDEGIGRLLRARRSRYGLWWLARGALGDAASDLVEATGGRVIRRDGAAEFLSDLRGRLAVFEAHPSGQTPAAVHEELLALLRSGDRVGVDELLRRERNAFDSALGEMVDRVAQRNANDPDLVREVWHEVRPVAERRLASLLVLGLHDPESLAAETRELVRVLERQPLRAGYAAWSEIPQFAVTWIGYVLGTVLVRLERIEALAPIVTQTWLDTYGAPELLVWLPGEASSVFGQALAPPGANWLSDQWEFLTSSTAEMQWLNERYPELSARGEPRRSMTQFDLILCFRHALIGHRSLAYFVLDGEAASDLALRLHADRALRGRVAQAIGVDLEEFDDKVPGELANADTFRGAVRVSPQGIANLLRQGRAGP